MATPPSRPSSALEARAAATTTPDAASTGQLIIEPQTLLILVGLPGAGKTTFATALCALPPRLGKRTWSRASQDDSPSKRRAEAEAAARAGLRRGDNVVVDRVDFDPEQRAHFITLARDANVRVFCLVLSPPLATLRQRLSTRTGHPTLPDAQTALGVLDRMRSQFVPPSRGEGIDRTLTITAWDEGVEAVLARLEDGVADKDLPPAARNTASGTRGRGYYRGGRGNGQRGYYRGGYAPRAGYPAPRGGYAGSGGYRGGDGHHARGYEFNGNAPNTAVYANGNTYGARQPPPAAAWRTDAVPYVRPPAGAHSAPP